MYVWMYVCIVCIYVCIYACIRVYIDHFSNANDPCLPIYIFASNVCDAMCVCLYICMYVCMYVCMYSMYVCVYTCMYTCKHVSCQQCIRSLPAYWVAMISRPLKIIGLFCKRAL